MLVKWTDAAARDPCQIAALPTDSPRLRGRRPSPSGCLELPSGLHVQRGAEPSAWQPVQAHRQLPVRFHLRWRCRLGRVWPDRAVVVVVAEERTRGWKPPQAHPDCPWLACPQRLRHRSGRSVCRSTRGGSPLRSRAATLQPP